MERIIVDGNNVVMRYFYASEDVADERLPGGKPVGVVKAILTFTQNLIKDYSPDEVIFAWDDARTWRWNLYKEYKQGRRKNETDEASERRAELFRVDVPLVREMLSRLGVKSLSLPYMEADDIIAVVTHYFPCEDNVVDVTIVSTDRDFVQLVSPHVRVLDPGKDTMTWAKDDGTVWNVDEMIARSGLHFLAYRMAMGDTSDNIKGLPGVGKKRASELLISSYVCDAHSSAHSGVYTWLVDRNGQQTWAQKAMDADRRDSIVATCESLMSLSTPAYAKAMEQGTGFSMDKLKAVLMRKYEIEEPVYVTADNRMQLYLRDAIDMRLSAIRFRDFITPFRALQERTRLYKGGY